MKAIKKNLTNQLGQSTPHDVMYCSNCGAEYSAHDGDYWDVPDYHQFRCCGKTMTLGYWRRTFIES